MIFNWDYRRRNPDSSFETTFVIDAAGKIQKLFPKVKVDGHANEVLAALAE